MRRLLVVLVLGMSFVLVPQSLAAPSPTQTAEHDPSVNTVSGQSGPSSDEEDEQPQPGDTPEEAVARQYPPNTIETFRFRIAEGESNSSFDVTVGWPNPNVDLDIYVYRVRRNQTLVVNPVTSAATLADPEIATYASPISDQPLRPSEYLVVVHNYCSNITDPGVIDPDTGDPACPGATDPDGPGGSAEDTWEAEVTFTAFQPGNKAPAVSLAGPTEGRTGQPLTYTTTASDPDGQIARISYDLNGDGIFETDGGPQATTSFATAGRYAVGVRVLDNAGEPSYASVDVTISGPPAPSAGTTAKRALLLTTFKLRGPVFGGRKNRKLTIRYRLRERATVRLTLYRGKRVVRRLVRGRSQRANRTFRVLVRPRKLRRGMYRVQIVALSADGQRRQSVRLKAKRL